MAAGRGGGGREQQISLTEVDTHASLCQRVGNKHQLLECSSLGRTLLALKSKHIVKEVDLVQVMSFSCSLGSCRSRLCPTFFRHGFAMV